MGTHAFSHRESAENNRHRQRPDSYQPRHASPPVFRARLRRHARKTAAAAGILIALPALAADSCAGKGCGTVTHPVPVVPDAARDGGDYCA